VAHILRTAPQKACVPKSLYHKEGGKDSAVLSGVAHAENVDTTHLHLSDEGVRQGQQRLKVYLDGAYRHLPGLASNLSAFDELSDHLSLMNVEVTREPQANVPSLLLLLPGCFEQADLVDFFARSLHTVAKRSATKRRSTVVDGARKSAQAVRALAKSRIEKAVGAVVQSSHVLPLYSTQQAFSGYMGQCQECSPQLAQMGIFSAFMFEKWPESILLQRAVAVDKILPWLTRVSPRLAKRESSKSLGMVSTFKKHRASIKPVKERSCTTSSLFLQKDQERGLPPPQPCGVAGVLARPSVARALSGVDDNGVGTGASAGHKPAKIVAV